MKNRHNPVSTTFRNIRSFPTTLVYYKIPASKFYQMRFYYEGKYYRKSSGETDEELAREKTKEFYQNILRNKETSIKRDITRSRTSFEKIGNELISQQQKLIDRKERNPKLNEVEKSMLTKHIVPFFKNKSIKLILRNDLEDFYLHLSKTNKLSQGSIKKLQGYLKKLFKSAYEQGLIEKQPVFPSVSTIDQPRPSFSEDQYELLKKTTYDLIKRDVVVRGHKIEHDMIWLIHFMMNTFIRPTDIKHLRHRNITETKLPVDDKYKKETKVLEIFYEHGKRKQRLPTYSMENAIHIYRKLKDFYKKKDEGTEPDDFVFLPAIKNRDFALRVIQRKFNKILETARLKKSNLNEDHSLYSLRHTAISYRVYDGVDLTIIARMANTSVDMVNRFYANHILNKMSARAIQLRHRRDPSMKGYN